ncbi:MAG: cysteine desulfurase [Firmicutes bacterium]|nr:cysteine desulfurase [Bacillota bacterium]
MIYLDNAATTKPDPRVLEAMCGAEEKFYFNSAGLYSGGINSKRELESAANLIQSRLTRSRSGQLVFTSGATEANNLLVFGKIITPRHRLVVLSGEHSSTYSPSVFLRQNNVQVDYIPLLKNGEADLVALARLVTPETTLVCFSLVNSDTGVLQDAKEIVRIIKGISPKTHVHCDAVQAFCKHDFDVEAMGLDSCAISAHKIYGPKGVGALWIRKGVTLRPIMFGGSDHGFRPGTENNAGVIGFARAVEIFDTYKELNHISTLHAKLVEGLPKLVTLSTGTYSPKNPYIANLLLPVMGHHMLNALSTKGIFVGLGSACSSRATKNRTMLAMGLTEKQSKNIIRVSFGRYNTLDEVEGFLKELASSLEELL